MTRPEFITAIEQLGINPKEAMDRLGVKSLSGLNLREALEQLAGVVPEKPEAPAEPEEIVFVEEDHSQEATVAQEAQPWDAMADGAINKLFTQANVKSVAAKEAFLRAQFGDRPYTREQAVAALEVAVEASGRTPDLNTLPAKAVH